jgi:hypothetical protein
MTGLSKLCQKCVTDGQKRLNDIFHAYNCTMPSSSSFVQCYTPPFLTNAVACHSSIRYTNLYTG